MDFNSEDLKVNLDIKILRLNLRPELNINISISLAKDENLTNKENNECPICHIFSDQLLNFNEQKFKMGSTPLHQIMSKNCTKCLNAVITIIGDNKIKLRKNKEKHDALYFALKYKSLDCIRMILPLRGKILSLLNATNLLVFGIIHKLKDITDFFLKKHSLNVLHEIFNFYQKISGKTFLHLASKWNNYHSLRNILRRMVKILDINSLDKDGNTPLHTAASASSYKCVKILCDKNADVFLRNNNGELAGEYKKVDKKIGQFLKEVREQSSHLHSVPENIA